MRYFEYALIVVAVAVPVAIFALVFCTLPIELL